MGVIHTGHEQCIFQALGSLSSVLGLGTLPCCTHAALAYLAEEQQTKASEPGTHHCLCSQRDPSRRPDMMLDLLGPFPLLLLLLGSWAPVHPLGDWAQPPTSVQMFILRHLRAGPVQCNTETPHVNHLEQCQKPENTFLHDSFQNVSDTWLLPNRTCSRGQKNGQQGANRTDMTHCNLTGRRYPHCRYSTAPQNRFYVVAITTLSKATLPIFCSLCT
ncbi:ribonuclease K6 isoform X2 [Ursus americanus]|uniref:ribonuclease K6 isoform X2 n=1 Tax=Ursus americanus TaxID=9643 RepID=UPI001E67DAA3|nr:ribonuclease K6 isoform X2 [Ursus americanus]